MFRKLLPLIIFISFISCKEESIPKPKGELRLEYPQPAYKKLDKDCPFSFELSKYAVIENSDKNDCWFYITYPKMKGKVFMTYYPINNDFEAHAKEAERMVYEHTIKASAIETKFFEYPKKDIYGNFYELKGQSASNLQFFVTDSTHHFVTGYVYFNARPNPDSIAPAVEYIRKDLKHLIDTFEWK